MHVVVCLKQIPNPDLQFQVDAGGTDIRRESVNYKTNGSDEYALEEAVRLKEKHGGTVSAVTVGPKRTEQMLREALAKGADEAVRIAYDDAAAVDPGQVARLLAETIRRMPHDLVLTGVQSDDYAYSMTGGLVAGLLGLPQVSVVTKVELSGKEVRVHRELEGGDAEQVALPLPAALTIQFGINQPRYAPLPAIMRAARAPIREVQPKDLGVPSWDAVAGPYRLAVQALAPPAARGRAQMVTGSGDVAAAWLAQFLREKGFFRG